MKLNKLNIIAAICLVIGLGLFIAGFAMLDFDISKLSTETPYEARSFISSVSIQTINIDDYNADIEISASADDKIHITYYENNNDYYDITESAKGDLIIKSKSSRKWYDYVFTFEFAQPKLLVEVPVSYNNNITVKSHDGYVLVKDIGVHDMLLTAFDDDIQVHNIRSSGHLEAKASDDNIYMSSSTVMGDISCHTFSGKIDLDAVEGKSIEAVNSDGRISLKSVISNESIFLKTTSDDIRLDTVAFREDFTCTVTDGNVKGCIAGKLADYSVTTKAIDGKSNLPESMSGGAKIINIKSTDGDIQIDFIG